MSEAIYNFNQSIFGILSKEYQLQVRAQRYWASRLGQNSTFHKFNILSDMQTMSEQILSNIKEEYHPRRWYSYICMENFINRESFSEVLPEKKLVFSSYKDDYTESLPDDREQELIFDKAAAITLLARENNLGIEHIDTRALTEENTLIAFAGKINSEDRRSPAQIELAQIAFRTRFLQRLTENLQKQKAANAVISR